MDATLSTLRRRTRRPTWRSPRRLVLGAGRRSKLSPPGASAPPSPAIEPSRAPEADRAIGLALMRYVPALLRWARRCGVAASDAPDVVQVVLLRAWRAWEQCTQPPHERAPWLFAITARAARDRARRRRTDPEIHDPAEMVEIADTAALPGDAMEQRETAATLEALRAGTTPERWRVFVAYEIEGVTIAALSTREAAPIGTIYTRLRSARRDVCAVVQRHRAKLVHAEQAAARRRREGGS